MTASGQMGGQNMRCVDLSQPDPVSRACTGGVFPGLGRTLRGWTNSSVQSAK